MTKKIIKAPFNFVPISDKVIFPEWADQISHDIPFSDGMSGEIELTIEAKSPIFIRNGHAQDNNNKNQESYNSFSNIDGKYFIPPTSLKGSIRNVLEIMSFSKLKLDERAKFAQKRDLRNNSSYELKKLDVQAKLHCGWLQQDGDDYKIIDCGIPERINHKEIDKMLRSDIMTKNFSEDSRLNLNKPDRGYDPKTAAYKYYILKDVYDKVLTNASFRKGEKELQHDSTGNIKGTIVFTGQFDKWKKKRGLGAGKFKEFVFPKLDNPTIHSLSEDEFRHFEFIYKDSDDWKWAKKKLSNSGIPVFFRLDKGEVKDFGMAFMYKIPYNNTPKDLLSEDHKSLNSFDMAECIFGYTSKDKSLRGRVQFSPAWATENAEVDKESILCLGSPKASYYPIYIRQEGKGGIVGNKTFKEYNGSGAAKPSLSGWKRYPARKTPWGAKTKAEYNEKLDTILYPLKAGVVFKGKLRYHNLRPIELGALLSAITFHNSKNNFHQIGQAKPYGYGKVQIGVNLTEEQLQSMIQYELYLDKNLSSSWYKMSQICELFAMSSDNVLDGRFEYMKLDVVNKNDEFSNAKKEGEYLEVFTKLVGGANASVESLLKGFKEEVDKLNAHISDAITNSDFIKAKELCAQLKLKDSEAANRWKSDIFEKEDSSKFNKIKDEILDLLSKDNIEKTEDLFKQLEIDFKHFSEKEFAVIKAAIFEKKNQSERLGQSYADFISKYDKLKTIEDQTKKYIKNNGSLSEEDEQALKGKLDSIYKTMKPRDQKQYKNFIKWKGLMGIIKEEIVKQWFVDITGEKL